MTPDITAKLEEITAKYSGRQMTAELRSEIAEQVLPILGDFLDHIDQQAIFNDEKGTLDLVLKARTPLGKMLLDMISLGAPEVS